MSEPNITAAILLPDGRVLRELPDGTFRLLEDHTDWGRLAAMTEDDVESGARSDPDNPPMTDDELRRLRREPDPRLIREHLRMTREEFARAFDLPVRDIADWEDEARMVDPVAQTYLRVIERAPDAVIAALDADSPTRAPREAKSSAA